MKQQGAINPPLNFFYFIFRPNFNTHMYHFINFWYILSQCVPFFQFLVHIRNNNSIVKKFIKICKTVKLSLNLRLGIKF